MRKFILIIMTLGFALNVMAKGGTDPVPQGDDLFPWPWGTECPFPWQDIEGNYQVTSDTKRPYTGHYLNFSVGSDSGFGAPNLNIDQYDHTGRLYATGIGRTRREDERLVRAVMTPVRGRTSYSVVVRTYTALTALEEGRAKCMKKDLVPAITFCPYRGRKCMTDSNYVLRKID